MSTNFPNGLRSRGVPLPSGGIPPTGGDVFHGDSGHAQASDTHTGKNPNHPLATIDNAVGKCAANNGDQIWVYPGHNEAVIAAAGLDLDVAGITIIFLGNDADRAKITFSTADSADMDVDAADITLINPRFVAGIDALTGPIDVNAARFKMYNVLVEDAAGIAAIDWLVADAAADDLLIDGWDYRVSTTGTQKQSNIQIAGADRPTLKNIRITGDFGTGAIENGTAWIDALLEDILIDNANVSPVVGILLQGTSSGQAHRVMVRIASGTTYITANNDMQWFECYGTGTDATAGDKIGTALAGDIEAKLDVIDGIVDDILVDTAVIGALGAGLTALATQASVNTVDDFLDTEIGGAEGATTESLHGKLGTDTELADRSLFDVLAGDGATAMPAAAIPANDVSVLEILRQLYAALEGTATNQNGVATWPVPAVAANNVSLAEAEHYDQSLLRDLLGSGLGIQDLGNIYYVDGGSTGPANDTGAGTSRAAPKKLLQSALDLCTTGNNDVVIVLNYGSAGRALESWPLELNKDMVHIVGVGNAAHAWAAVCPPSGSATHAFEVTGNRCTIANLCIAGGDGKAGIHVSSGAAPWGLLVRQCIFGVDNASATTQEAILIDSGGDAPYLTILDCYFTGTAGAGGGLTGDAIKIAGNATRGRIGKPGQGNFFQGLASGKIGINVTGGLVGMAIEGNRFALEEDTAGVAITLGGSSGSCWVAGNNANENVTDITANPFTDSSSGINHWGLNYKGVTAQLPA
ncbi:MAG: hypothetical protein Q8P22_11610 [Chloroflexota bacterium]|nr:hypothetical protein [Chloroflexota bacterium]